MSDHQYLLSSYGRMVADRNRMDPYIEALRRTVRPGDIVFDVGAGIGVFALMALKFGASKAVAIEGNGAVNFAREFAAAEGLGDRLEVVHGSSLDYHPPQRADIIVCDLRGALPIFKSAIPSIVDARSRLLKPGGTFIPKRDRVMIALICAPKFYREFEVPWHKNRLGLNLEAGSRAVVHEIHSGRFTDRHLLSTGRELVTIDYSTVSEPDIAASYQLEATRDGIAHGFALWFETELADGIGYSSVAPRFGSVYPRRFYPFARPIRLAAGDRVAGDVVAQLVGDDYLWHWRTEARTASGAAIAEYRQSSAFAGLYTTAPLHAASEQIGAVPDLESDRYCLEQFAAGQSVDSIADELHARFGAKFADRRSALDYVGRLAQRYDRS